MKRIHRTFIFSFLLLMALSAGLTAQGTYHDYKALSEMIRSLGRDYPRLCTVFSLAKTEGGREVQGMAIGKGDLDSKPAIAVFGGVDGSHILGRELAAGFAALLLKNSGSPSGGDLLDKVTFYVFPDVSPDASDQFFSALKYERSHNARPSDDDRDFSIDEDCFEDLNRDGYITLVRVKDPAGSFVMSKDDNRIMVPADLSAGEKGEYRVFSEGTDNDKDGLFNEDIPGGVDFDRNFPFGYEFFAAGRGSYPVSEPETRAVADFLFSKFNIFAVFTFGPEDNLGQPPKAEAPDGKTPVISVLLKEDEPLYKLVSDKYHSITGVRGAPVSREHKGSFPEWAYFDYGRYSFGTPAWWFPCEKDTNPGVAFMKYADKNGLGPMFVPWARIEHPDFPGKIAEVGGIRPFAMNTPPADSLEKLTGANYNFITAMADLRPELEFTDILTEDAGEGVYRITLKLHNKGLFATIPAIAADNIYTRILRISLVTSPDQKLISGLKVTSAGRLEGNQAKEYSWLISGRGKIVISAGAINTGTITTAIELR